MKKTLRASVLALAMTATVFSVSSANAAPPPAAAAYPSVWTLAAIGYGLGFGFCTALAFGKQTAAAGPMVVGPHARMQAVKDCLLPPVGIRKWTKGY